MDVTPTIEVALPELEVDIFINPRLEGLTVAPIEFVTPQEWEIFDEAPLDLGGQNPLIIG